MNVDKNALNHIVNIKNELIKIHINTRILVVLDLNNSL
jgi:hypothetical protein